MKASRSSNRLQDKAYMWIVSRDSAPSIRKNLVCITFLLCNLAIIVDAVPIEARVLRLLASQHFFREISLDTFTNTRASLQMDTGKKASEIKEYVLLDNPYTFYKADPLDTQK